MPGTLFVVATPIGNLEDITARALRILREVALIAAEDTRRTGHLLARYAISTPSTSLHEHNEATKTRSIIARLQQGESVALVSDAGTPTISDPGQRLIRSAIEANVRVEAIPGPSAALAALAASGIPSDTFTFLGFPPTRSTDRKKWLTDLCSAGRTVVFFEAPHRIRTTLSQIQAMAGDRTVVVARELTKVYEELVRGPISEVLDRLHSPRGELTIVIDIGQMPYFGPVDSVDDRKLFAEFGELTLNLHLSRRQAINLVARRHHLPANLVYDAIERAKKSTE
jgi:16S rRNA (cytidine1402-2'-O)-methyltransferase